MRSTRDELVAEVVVALTDTLSDAFDVADLLYTLTTACVPGDLRPRPSPAAGVAAEPDEGRIQVEGVARGEEPLGLLDDDPSSSARAPAAG